MDVTSWTFAAMRGSRAECINDGPPACHVHLDPTSDHSKEANMRKHPLLAFVTAIISCSIPGTVSAARGDTIAAKAQASGQTSTQPLSAVTNAIHHRARAHHLHVLVLEARAKARARHLHLRAEAKARARAHHLHVLALEAKHKAEVQKTARSKSRAEATVRSAIAQPYTTAGGVWLSLRTCESHNNYGENTGNGYYGAYQFSVTSWHFVGGTGLPNTASPEVQDALAQALLTRQGWHAWPTCSWKIGIA
jgi:hypothetical protein